MAYKPFIPNVARYEAGYGCYNGYVSPPADVNCHRNHQSVATVATVAGGNSQNETPTVATVASVARAINIPAGPDGIDAPEADDLSAFEPDIETPIEDPVFWQGIADERNANAACANRTDRYCRCQRAATIATGRQRRTKSNPEGVERWWCRECFDAADNQRGVASVSKRQSP